MALVNSRSSQLTSSWSARTRYRSYLSSVEGVGSYRRFQELLYGAEDTVADCCRRILTDEVRKFKGKSLTACEVGAGDGRRTRVIWRAVRKLQPDMALDLVEQSPIYGSALRTTAEASSGWWRVHESRYEEFDSSATYDVMLFVHSIFGIEGTDLVGRLLADTNRPALVVFASNAQASFLGRLKLILDRGYSEERLEIGSVRTSLESKDVDYEVIEFKTRWSIEADQFEEAVAILASWLALGRYESLPRECRRAFEVEVRESSHVSSERIEWEEEEEIIVARIQKTDQASPTRL